jgi:hypothetical protein
MVLHPRLHALTRLQQLSLQYSHNARCNIWLVACVLLAGAHTQALSEQQQHCNHLLLAYCC